MIIIWLPLYLEYCCRNLIAIIKSIFRILDKILWSCLGTRDSVTNRNNYRTDHWAEASFSYLNFFPSCSYGGRKPFPSSVFSFCCWVRGFCLLCRQAKLALISHFSKWMILKFHLHRYFEWIWHQSFLTSVSSLLSP